MVRLESGPKWLVRGGAGAPDSHPPPYPHGTAPNNLEARLPGEGSDLARQVAKDPLVLDFLGLAEEAQGLAMEEAMTLRMAQTLAEFGPGFAFIGRQYHLDVDGDDFFIDLLLYHVPSDRYVVVELKAGKFKPEHLGQLNFYVAAVDDMLKLPRQAATGGYSCAVHGTSAQCATPSTVQLSRWPRPRTPMRRFRPTSRRPCRPRLRSPQLLSTTPRPARTRDAI